MKRLFLIGLLAAVAATAQAEDDDLSTSHMMDRYHSAFTRCLNWTRADQKEPRTARENDSSDGRTGNALQGSFDCRRGFGLIDSGKQALCKVLSVS